MQSSVVQSIIGMGKGFMEFKDYLKKLRKEKNLTQNQLASAVFVSRSAVAKWENGLGLPSDESYRALLDYFGIQSTEFPLCEIEQIVVQKNRRIRALSTGIFCMALAVLIILALSCALAINNGFGFTSKMAAGENWGDNPRIRTDEYDFYYYTFGDDQSGTVIGGFAAVKKLGIGYRKIDVPHRRVYVDDSYVGILYSFEGAKSYYNIFRKNLSQTTIEYPTIFDELQSKEDSFEVLHSGYFVTSFEVTEFIVHDYRFVVE